MIYLIREFINIIREEGFINAIKATIRFFRHRLTISRIRRKAILYRLRKRHGDSVVCEINNSLMELDISPNSPNKLERTLAIEGIREPGATQTYQNVLDNLRNRYSSIHVFDIGANVGYFALMAAELLDENGQVYAIEAEPENAQRLRSNIDLNGYRNIIVHQIAAGAERTQLELSLRSSSNVHRMTEVLEDSDSVGSVDVEVYPIDHLISEYDIPSDELIIIRMDVEGYESHVLAGMSDLLASDRPVYLFAEIHPSRDVVHTGEIADVLNEHGFSAEYISTDGGGTYQAMISIDQIRDLGSNGHIMVSRFE